MVNRLIQSAEVKGEKHATGCMKQKQNDRHMITCISVISISHSEWIAFSF